MQNNHYTLISYHPNSVCNFSTPPILHPRRLLSWLRRAPTAAPLAAPAGGARRGVAPQGALGTGEGHAAGRQEALGTVRPSSLLPLCFHPPLISLPWTPTRP